MPAKRKAPAARPPKAPAARPPKPAPPSSQSTAVDSGAAIDRAAADQTPVRVTLRTATGPVVAPMIEGGAFQLATTMPYVLRSRRTWAETDSEADKLTEECRRMLEKYLGINEEMLRTIAASSNIEVQVPYDREAIGWAARIMPWEFLLSRTTKKYRFERPLTVTRWLHRQSSDAKPYIPERLLFVETAPGELRDGYVFDSERELVFQGLGRPEMERLEDPTADQLRAAVTKMQPDVIHVTGFDNHQGLSFLNVEGSEPPRDGVLLCHSNGRPHPVSAEEAAAILNAGARKPALVSLNLFNSASRVAALAVAGGAHAAIGFQDEFDDPLAELFFATLYRDWRVEDWKLHRAFELALTALRAHPSLRGTGIALWSAYSAFEGAKATKRAGVKRRKALPSSQARTRSDSVRKPSGDIGITVDPWPTVNYSMLHNNRELFEVFLLRKFGEKDHYDIQVKVTLWVGSESYPYESTFQMRDPVVDLSKDIRVPLISSVGRSVRESMRTAIGVDITCDGVTRYRRTHPVLLLPIDEWRDDDENRHWLPSFVLPRDPAVLRVIQSAQRYLMALRDDPIAGFDGYQSYGEEGWDDAGEPIDLQVRAIWAALTFEIPLSYINPPPSFTEYSQRLRTPSAVCDGKRGTCIDLALLLSACLEYVGINPIIILLDGHAFAGYWRSEDAHQRFHSVIPTEATIETAQVSMSMNTLPVTGDYIWLIDKPRYNDVLEAVRSNELVLLETVLLTKQAGFWDAVAEGEKNLRNRREFHSLIDMAVARGRQVTPLPTLLDQPRMMA